VVGHGATGAWLASGTPNMDDASYNGRPYFEFTLDTSNFSGGTLTMAFDIDLEANGDWANPGNNFALVYVKKDGGTFGAPVFSQSSPKVRCVGLSFNVSAGGRDHDVPRHRSRRTCNKAATVLLDNVIFSSICTFAKPHDHQGVCGQPDCRERHVDADLHVEQPNRDCSPYRRCLYGCIALRRPGCRDTCGRNDMRRYAHMVARGRGDHADLRQPDGGNPTGQLILHGASQCHGDGGRTAR
jgi:hypothetical protein